MMMPFYYKKISREFVSKLSTKILDGESAVLLGARYIGKRYMINCLHGYLIENKAAPLIRMGFLGETPLTSRQEVSRLITQAAAQAGYSLCPDEQPAKPLLDPIDQIIAQSNKPVYLLATNVDGMAHHLARRFLEEVRTRVEKGDLVVVLSGEHDFHDLVHGPNSEFNCANQYVLQGLDSDEFSGFVSRYARALNLWFEPPEDEVYRHLYQITGGNAYILRLLMWTIVERRSRLSDFQNTPLTVSDIPQSLETRDIPGAYGADIFRYTMRLIGREPGCWTVLEDLLDNNPVTVEVDRNAPGPLELSVLAVREDKKLRFASPLMEEFAKTYYDGRRFADLHARHKQWDEAFRRYAALDPEQRVRPFGIDDRGDLEIILRGLSAELYSAATKGVQEVRKRFAQGCSLLLGFREVTFWHYAQGWRHQLLDEFPAGEDSITEIANLLPSGSILSPGPLPVPESSSIHAATILPALRSDQQGAVVLSDFEKRSVLSRERKQLVTGLLQHFLEAYTHAVNVDRDRGRLWVRNRHIEIVSSIFEALGSRVLDVEQALAMAVRGLRNMEYRRVLFCLVDPEGKRIQGVLDDSDDPSVDIARMTDWPLNEPTADLQPYVIHTRQPKVVPDADQEPLANKEVAQSARVKSAAIVPILNRAGDAVGTIHVERADGDVPSPEEVANLMSFGHQLAIVIEQSERINLLESALDKVPEPILIVDRLVRPRYANAPATNLFGVKSGWQNRGESAPLSKTDETLTYLQEALTEEQRIVHHVQGIGDRKDYRGAVLCDFIRRRDESDRLHRTVGALLHVQDLGYLYRILEAFQLVAEAKDTPSAMYAMLDAAKLLGHEWGRLYLVDENDPDCFVSNRSFGFKDPEFQAKFDARQIRLPRRTECEGESWMSVQGVAPLVFCFKKDIPDRTLIKTVWGQDAINIQSPNCPEELEKNEGDFWLDFPFIVQQTIQKESHAQVLGKLTLQWDGDQRPENFELLNVLWEMVVGLLDAFLRRDRQFGEREQWIQVAAAEKTLSSIAHNIATRLGSLSGILYRYQEIENGCSPLKEVNDDFDYIFNDVLTTVNRTKELVASIVLSPIDFDLHGVFKRALGAILPDENWTLECNEKHFQVIGDRHLLESALSELLQNSREAVTDPKCLRISMIIESVRRGSQDWVRIVYKDNGPGVPADLKARIFEDFFSHRPGRKGGIGLGLSFFRRVIKAHGGIVFEQGSSGQGAEFVVEIPRAVASSQMKEETHVSHSDC